MMVELELEVVVVSSNRTFMELKLAISETFDVDFGGSNRTFMELKCLHWTC